MKIIQGTTDIWFDFPTAVTLGKFDGLHIGHQKLIRELKSVAKADQKVVVFTFDIPPASVLHKSVPVLTTRDEKRRLMAAMGVDYLIEYPFTEETRKLDAAWFVRELLCGRLCMKTMAVGPDCRFGYERHGDVALLRRMGEELDFSLHVVEKVRTAKDGQIVSSSRVKDELKKGDIEEANRLLGYLYSVNGQVVNDQGTQITARLREEKGVWMIDHSEGECKLVLPPGRYFSKVWLGGRVARGVTNIVGNVTGSGELLTILNKPISEKNDGFMPEISLIAQYHG